MKIFSWTLIIYQIIILFLSLSGSVTFGSGLGDLGIILVYSIIILILSIFNRIALKKEKQNGSRILPFISIGFCFIAALTLTLYFTIWRGSEYPWNGELFYPSSSQKKEYTKQDNILKSNYEIANNKIKTNPNDFKSYLNRARLSKSLQKNDEAIKDYKKALELNDTNLSANLEIGEVYWDIENYETALKYNEKALSLDTSYFLSKHRVNILREEIAKHSP